MGIESSWHAYPKVYALGHRAVQDIFKGATLAEEKIDGSQLSFGIFDGKIKCRSKTVEQDIDAPDKMFTLAIETVLRIAPLLHDGWTYRGEFLRKPKHNTLTYERVPDQNIIIYDVNTGNECYMSYEDKVVEATRIGLATVPQLVVLLNPMTIATLDALLQTPSCLGGTTIEGVVFKNYEMFTKDGKAMMCKYVSEKFKEQNQKNWKKTTNKDVVALLIEQYKTKRRWEKAIEHLRDAGQLTDSPKDIGALIKEVAIDVREECGDEMAQKLLEHSWKQIQSGIIRGLPEWYKRRLAKSVLETNE